MSVAVVRAPAKLNFGVEILGRRSDGYHEIRTVLAMVDLVDIVTVRTAQSRENRRAVDLTDVSEAEDLSIRALNLLSSAAHPEYGATVAIEKHIPAGAGLGGASSDAAATLVAARTAWNISSNDAYLVPIAARLGSDVPFFLGGACSLASGTGTTLQSLPPLGGWAVIVTPPLRLQRKTATLYAALQPSDFSDGGRIDSVAAAIQHGMLPSAAAMQNAFARPLYELAPWLSELPMTILKSGAPFAALSGAGPSHFTVLREHRSAEKIAAQLVKSMPPTVGVVVAPLRQHGLIVERSPMI